MNEWLLQLRNNNVSSKDIFKNLIASIRPSRMDDVKVAELRLSTLQQEIESNPEIKTAFATRLTALIGNARQSELFTHVTAVSRGAFFSELRKLAFYKILPPVYDENELSDFIRLIFSNRNDYKWFCEMDSTLFANFIQSTGIIPPAELPVNNYIVQELLDDLYLLTQVITSLSIDSHILKNFNELLTVQSPFNKLHLAIAAFTDGIKNKTIARTHVTSQYNAVAEQLNFCNTFVTKIRESKSEVGTSLHLTIVLQKLTKCLGRIKSLLALIIPGQQNENYLQLAQFMQRIVKIELQRNSLRNFFNETISLVAFQITEHTGKTGEHYVTSTAKEYWQMFYASLKGGLVVAFLVLGKILIQFLKLPIFQDTLFKAFNYSLGFVGIHVWKGVLATKQPAMTASAIAQSIESSSTQEEIKELGNFIIRVFRSQFIAVVGNLVMVFPVAFAIGYFYLKITGNYLLTPEEAHHKFEMVNPIHSLALLHAAIAGVMLFTSGILSGLADNGNVFNRYSHRLQYSGVLVKMLGKAQTKKLSNYISKNLGSLTGNFTLGFLLAFVFFIGSITGLPLDIMHVTFATGNLGMATSSIIGDISIQEGIIATLGIIGIGMMNISVSFTLALIVAIKSRGIDLSLTPGILKYLIKEFFKRPLEFFLPAKKV